MNFLSERMNMPAPPPPPLHTNNIKITPSTDTEEGKLIFATD